MRLYTVTVRYKWSGCCYSGESEVDVELYAPSRERAEQMAARTINRHVSTTKILKAFVSGINGQG